MADFEAVLFPFLQAVTNVLATSTIANNCVENVFIMVFWFIICNSNVTIKSVVAWAC